VGEHIGGADGDAGVTRNWGNPEVEKNILASDE
jgi:hypothetical protein